VGSGSGIASDTCHRTQHPATRPGRRGAWRLAGGQLVDAVTNTEEEINDNPAHHDERDADALPRVGGVVQRNGVVRQPPLEHCWAICDATDGPLPLEATPAMIQMMKMTWMARNTHRKIRRLRRGGRCCAYASGG
jgi:hypothetical protein